MMEQQETKSIATFLSNPNNNNSNKRTIVVEAVGHSKSAPDTSHLLITVSSNKATVVEAKNSVERRIEYILQSIHNNQIKDSERRIFNSVKNIDGLYEQRTEIYITSSNPDKLESISAMLTKKLDHHVQVSTISYSISEAMKDYLRAQSANNAVQNARKRATEMVRLLDVSLGTPLFIEQSECEETTQNDMTKEAVRCDSQFLSWYHTMTTMSNRVKITFELRPKRKL